MLSNVGTVFLPITANKMIAKRLLLVTSELQAIRTHFGTLTMQSLRFAALLLTSVGTLLAISAASPDCWAFTVFVGDCYADPGCIPPNNPSTDFNLATNWMPAVFPNATDAYLIQDAHTAIFSSGSTSLGGLTVSQ